MVVPHLDFHRSSEPARSPCLTELTQNQWIASSKLTGEDPGMEIAFPYAGNFEIIQGPTKVSWSAIWTERGAEQKRSFKYGHRSGDGG